MENAQQPTKCTRHMNIKTFSYNVILLCLKQIDTADTNYGDALTKNVSCTLLYHEMNFVMGCVFPAYTYSVEILSFRVLYHKCFVIGILPFVITGGC